jgi:hypothetical protein
MLHYRPRSDRGLWEPPTIDHLQQQLEVSGCYVFAAAGLAGAYRLRLIGVFFVLLGPLARRPAHKARIADMRDGIRSVAIPTSIVHGYGAGYGSAQGDGLT